MASVPSTAVSADAVAAVGAAAKKRAAAPDWKTINETFGEAGVVRNKRGRQVGYRYPKTGDPERDRRTSQKVYEMWQPHRRVSAELGGEVSARHSARAVRVKTEKGVRLVAPERAEEFERKHGERRSFGYSRRYAEAPYWKRKKS